MSKSLMVEPTLLEQIDDALASPDMIRFTNLLREARFAIGDMELMVLAFLPRIRVIAPTASSRQS